MRKLFTSFITPGFLQLFSLRKKTKSLPASHSFPLADHPFSQKTLAQLDQKLIPEHVAIIPDGNRRWARAHKMAVAKGHSAGGDIIMDIVKAAKQLGIKTLTIYVWSTENWSRPSSEIDYIFSLLDSYLNTQRQPMIDNGVKMDTIGDLSKLPKNIVENIEKTKSATAKGDKVNLVLALNYGGRDEIKRAVTKLVQDCLDGVLPKQQICEATIANYLDTAAWKDPDLLIRAGGEWRVSNFLLWQISYAEIYSTEVLWPDFTPRHLFEAILHYQKRERRLGGA